MGTQGISSLPQSYDAASLKPDVYTNDKWRFSEFDRSPGPEDKYKQVFYTRSLHKHANLAELMWKVKENFPGRFKDTNPQELYEAIQLYLVQTKAIDKKKANVPEDQILRLDLDEIEKRLGKSLKNPGGTTSPAPVAFLPKSGQGGSSTPNIIATKPGTSSSRTLTRGNDNTTNTNGTNALADLDEREKALLTKQEDLKAQDTFNSARQRKVTNIALDLNSFTALQKADADPEIRNKALTSLNTSMGGPLAETLRKLPENQTNGQADEAKVFNEIKRITSALKLNASSFSVLMDKLSPEELKALATAAELPGIKGDQNKISDFNAYTKELKEALK